MRILDKIYLTGRSALAAVVLSAFVCGCTAAQKQTELQIITNVNTHIPEVVAAADTVAATIGALLPQDAAIIAVASTAFDTGARTLQALTAAYIANPSASALAQIQTAITTLEGQVNTATLNAVGIKDTVLQQTVIASLKGLLTILTVAFALISPTLSTAQLDAIRASHQIQLAKVRKYMDENELQADLPNVNLNVAFRYATSQGM